MHRVIIAVGPFGANPLLWTSSNYNRYKLIAILKHTMSHPFGDVPLGYTADVDKYFERTGYTGSREPTIQVLKEVVWHHQMAFPFENLDVHLRKPISLSLKDVEEKFVAGKRGGFCTEQKILLFDILKQLGFDVKRCVGRVNYPVGVITANTHAILHVRFEDPSSSWIVDCGFGPNGPTYPLQLNQEEPVETETMSCPYRVRRFDGFEKYDWHTTSASTWAAEYFNHGQQSWDIAYTFNLVEAYLPDYELCTWYVESHPQSRFTNNIIVSRFTPTMCYWIFNKSLNIRRNGTREVEERPIASQEEYLSVLKEYFDISLPEGTVLHPPKDPW